MNTSAQSDSPRVLLERQAPLEQIGVAWNDSASGCGKTVLISGEAGVGKTTLIEAFVANLADDVPVFRGGCEALFAARPLGPLFDIAGQLGSDFAELLQAGADNHLIYSEFLKLIKQPDFSGAIIIIEDIHWADNATMDFLKFIGRRISQAHSLFLATFRDDEIGSNHPLHHVLGDLPTDTTDRIKLETLSLGAIAEMGDCDEYRAQEIFEITNGNPFFVQELLSSPDTGIPSTITDAILSKAARLSAEARQLLNLVSVVPRKCELLFLETAFDNATELVDECAEKGLLLVDRDFAAFRHELARLAIEDALPAGQRSKWNNFMLDALRKHRPDAFARLAHHADMSGNRDEVLEYAPAAAAEAAMLGAHRESVALYRQALSNADLLDDRHRADLIEGLAYESYVTGNIKDAIEARHQCLELGQTIVDEVLVARSHRWLSRLYWFIGKRQEAEEYAELALEVDATLRSTNEYAMACSNRAQLHMLGGEVADATDWSNKAIHLATANGDTDTLVHALNNLGTALGTRSPDEGMPHLERSLELSLENNLQEHAARAYTNITSNLVSDKQYTGASKYLDAGIEYAAERDLDSWLYYMQGWRARLRLEVGDWDGAADDALAVTRNYRGAALIASPAMSALARLRLRRGDPDSGAALESALSAIADTNEIQRFAPLVATKAEQAWLFGDNFDEAETLLATRDWAARLELLWFVGELSWWARKLGIPDETDSHLREPHDLLLCKGDWAGAARAWEGMGCPYERALALAEGDIPAQKEALRIFIDLGAEPAAAGVRRELRAQGVKDLPREARRSTKNNPAGLTNRQLAVLQALMDGLSDADIAARLFISPRTASHHVSAILSKLGAQSRNEAAATARKLGMGSEN